MSSKHDKDKRTIADDISISNGEKEHSMFFHCSSALNNNCGNASMTDVIDSKKLEKSVCGSLMNSLLSTNKTQDRNKQGYCGNLRCTNPFKRNCESSHFTLTSTKRQCCTGDRGNECEEAFDEPSTSNHQFDNFCSRRCFGGFESASELRLGARKSESHLLPMATPTNCDVEVISELHGDALKIAEKNKLDRESPTYCAPHSLTVTEFEQAKKLDKDGNLVPFYSPHPLSKSRVPSSVVSPDSSFANSVVSISKRNSIFIDSIEQRSRDVNRDNCLVQEAIDNSAVYIPGVDLLVDDSEFAPIDLISRFSRTPISSPKVVDPGSTTSCALAGPLSSSHIFNQLDSNVAQRRTSSAATSSLSAISAGMELSKATKERCALLRQRRRAQPAERQPLPALHLHLSKDGTSPLPPGWQRAPNTKRSVDGQDSGDSSGTYAYYYYHVRTRQTRWDPPVYPWDADPTDTLLGETGEDDPEAPYNWGCASRFAVTHEEIEAMYSRVRQRILERQCIDLLHELAGRPDAPQDVAEQGFAIELFTLVHNTLRSFRDARCKLGRIVNDEDLYY
ncbi:Histone-lysine N-methyltransferase SETD2 [Schistosoma japonicum]|uniref:Histone-lysine N-methyltransferase SETD2 n=1 Tax=Schistosoma japonicum TaxID=6182 RepID=A0A4Z2D1J7_SCHJA|nr:Histone-lysine N-methyltransferase SETD2 [Schistosoma japonicum]TNN10268.1 Histone-lysine N-methyltransferase SETD2 [Schistosoma japonicum]